eukprot:353956-Prymnesium_polylepis.1
MQGSGMGEGGGGAPRACRQAGRACVCVTGLRGGGRVCVCWRSAPPIRRTSRAPPCRRSGRRWSTGASTWRRTTPSSPCLSAAPAPLLPTKSSSSFSF